MGEYLFAHLKIVGMLLAEQSLECEAEKKRIAGVNSFRSSKNSRDASRRAVSRSMLEYLEVFGIFLEYSGIFIMALNVLELRKGRAFRNLTTLPMFGVPP